MIRTILACSVICSLAVTAGCRMCAHPYDYSGPLVEGGCASSCDPGARAGSILSPGAGIGCGCDISGAEVPYGAVFEDAPLADNPAESGTSNVAAAPRRLRAVRDDSFRPMPGVQGPARMARRHHSHRTAARVPTGPRLW